VSSQHLHQSLQWLSGVAAVATDVGHLLLVDLCLDDFYYKQNELEALGKLAVFKLAFNSKTRCVFAINNMHPTLKAGACSHSQLLVTDSGLSSYSPEPTKTGVAEHSF